MTVKEWIANGLISGAEERLSKLEEIGAPTVVIEGQKKFVANLKNGVLSVSGDKDTLEDEFESAERKTGRGGKAYYIINNRISFYPAAKYGMFIKRN